MTRPAVDHLRTQPLYPATPEPAPWGAIPAQRNAAPAHPAPVLPAPAGAGPAGPAPAGGPCAEPAVVARPVPRSRLFAGAAVLTGCALISSIGATVVLSLAGDVPAPAVSASAPGTGAARVPPAQLGSMGPAGPVPVPGQIGGEGIYGVGADLQPGTYHTAGPSPAAFDNCYWERSRDTSGQQKSVIASGIVTGPFTVTIKRTDKAFKTSGCEAWTKVQ